MKNLRKTRFYLGLQIEHFPTRVLIHQLTYTEKILKCFYMDKAHSLSFPMVVYSLDVKNEPFRPYEKVKNYLVLKYHILVSLMHLYILLTVLAQILCFFCQFIN